MESMMLAEFQFHTGSIKRSKRPMTQTFQKPFQFHTGSIKRNDLVTLGELKEMFQFHTGSIKSWFGTKFTFH